MITYVAAFLCVLGLAAGQMLFKISALSWAESGTLFAVKTAGTLLAAMCLYGITSVAWVWVLQKAELGRVYPLVAIAFVLVPMGSFFFFNERFHPQYFIGVAMIIAGIVIAIRA